MKKIVLLAAFYFAGIGFAFSQTGSVQEGPKLLNRLRVTCELTRQQTARLQPIVAKHVDALKADKQKYTGAELTAADNAENASFEGKLKALLSTDQMNKYKSIQQ